MTLTVRVWLFALTIALGAHVALALGVHFGGPGGVARPAGQPTSIVGSLSGVLGGPAAAVPVAPAAANMAETSVVEQARVAAADAEAAGPVDPAETVSQQPSPVQATVQAAVQASAVHAAPPNEVTPTPAEGPTALASASVTANPVAAVAAEATDTVGRAAAIDPRVVEADGTVVDVDAARAKARAERAARARAERAKQRARARARNRERRAREREKAAAKARARAASRAASRASSAARRPGSARQGNAGRARGGKRGRRSASAGAMRSYGARVRARILSNRPRSRGRGTVVVAFGVSSSGRLRYARVARRSGLSSLDRAALTAVRRASPFPRPPAGATQAQLMFSIPFTFR